MQAIVEKRVVPVAVIDKEDDAVPVAEALMAGGLNLIEITFRTAAAEQAIRRIATTLPGMVVGAGTLLSAEQVDRALTAGARFGVAPGLNPKVAQKAIDLKLPFVPGVMTPSEIERALELGLKLLKFFPAEQAGGVKMLKALAGPYAQAGVKFIPLGGVTPVNAAEYLALPVVAAIGGSWLVEKKLVAERNWKEIARRTAEALQLAARTRVAP
jgi:2-dehydro-3-deoxyphosphogluconate aldolase / (4S)-4-hydroxy-2-oxoglutarate aldolase